MRGREAVSMQSCGIFKTQRYISFFTDTVWPGPNAYSPENLREVKTEKVFETSLGMMRESNAGWADCGGSTIRHRFVAARPRALWMPILSLLTHRARRVQVVGGRFQGPH